MKKKTFKEIHGKTRVGKFLKEKAPGLLSSVLNIAGDVIPGAEGVTGIISNLISGDTEISAEDKLEALTLLQLDMADLKDAREMYEAGAKDMTDSLATRVIKVNLPMIIGLVLLNIGSVYYLADQGEIIAIVSNFIGIAIGNLFNERQAVINFFFGSSQGSKDKNNLFKKSDGIF